MKIKKYSLPIIVVGLTFLATLAIAGDPPNKIIIKSMENLYKPVKFDHKMHIGTAESCKSCHHTGFSKPMACSECHDEAVDKSKFNHEKHFDYDTCVSCHQVKSTKAVACSTCHKVPYDKERLEVIGLKGAFHGQCMGCHKENGVDTSCASCHVKK